MSEQVVLRTFPLDFPWRTRDPFLVCVHHRDAYPQGNGELGPAASLAGRNLGSDFSLKDGWRMYHGQRIPGFPAHPHRGFETVTIVSSGLVDHADSLGAAGRYGDGDVQWLTTGAGVQHSEMFPLTQTDADNPLELFQIWLNLPAKAKMSAPDFKMLWRETIPKRRFTDDNGGITEVEIIAGQLDDSRAPDPTPDSWASDANNHVAIWLIKMSAHARWHLPAAIPGLNRSLYLFEGKNLRIGDSEIETQHGVDLLSEQSVAITNGEEPAQLLLLQGRPINEPIAQYGPFVMNNEAEIRQAFKDYHATEFGGWPWPSVEPDHGMRERFAKHVDGREEEPKPSNQSL